MLLRRSFFGASSSPAAPSPAKNKRKAGDEAAKAETVESASKKPKRAPKKAAATPVKQKEQEVEQEEVPVQQDAVMEDAEKRESEHSSGSDSDKSPVASPVQTKPKRTSIGFLACVVQH